jgi:hypothetical protein
MNIEDLSRISNDVAIMRRGVAIMALRAGSGPSIGTNPA